MGPTPSTQLCSKATKHSRLPNCSERSSVQFATNRMHFGGVPVFKIDAQNVGNCEVISFPMNSFLKSSRALYLRPYRLLMVWSLLDIPVSLTNDFHVHAKHFNCYSAFVISEVSSDNVDNKISYRKDFLPN